VDNFDEQLASIDKKFKEMHITGYYFGPMINIERDGSDLSAKLIDKVILVNKLRSKVDFDFMYFSDHHAEKCFHLHKNSFASSDPFFIEMSKMKIKTRVAPKSGLISKKQRKWLEIMDHFGYKARGASIFELKHAQPFLGMLIFFSDKSPEELSEIILKNDKFSENADALAEYIATDINSKANPWVALGAISNNSHEILQYLYQGMDTQEIAEQMSMTKRGVDYHIETLKELLQAKTRVHLMVKALKEGMLSLS